MERIPCTWLEGETGEGATRWGCPWPRGNRVALENLRAVTTDGEPVALDSWPLAYWPDGSLKVTGHAAVLPPCQGVLIGESPERPSPVTIPIRITEDPQAFTIDTGTMVYIAPREGARLATQVADSQGKVRSHGADLVARVERRTSKGDTIHTSAEDARFQISRCVVERRGTQAAVILQTGTFFDQQGRGWAQVEVRSEFYAGRAEVRYTATWFFAGDEQRDFPLGFGIRFQPVVTGELHDRHVVFTGGSGICRESARGLDQRRISRYPGPYQRQHAGQPADIVAGADPEYDHLVADLATWNDFALDQDIESHYTIRKKTGQSVSWVDRSQGHRSLGVAGVSSAAGTLAVSARDFWQKAPASVQVLGLCTETPSLTLWFRSPEAGADDLRHYDTCSHVDAAYEGVTEVRASAFGVANTSEALLTLGDGFLDDQGFLAMARENQAPAQLVADRGAWHQSGIFGVWGMPDHTSPTKAALETILGELVDFYLAEVEQRQWYGYWNYGDVMHTYDPVRHCWRYDVGGYAWQNTELIPNLWLWLTFLRTGRSDVFRMASAMSRHTSEVDIYHFGPYAGLGTRHNVVHWGCSCKEPRISMAHLHRPYFFLTADDRIANVLDEVKDSDFASLRMNPAKDPQLGFPAYARSGPDWSAYCSNWMVRTERFQDGHYWKKLQTGIDSLKAMPYRLCSGSSLGYQPADGSLHHYSDGNYQYHMVIAFGAPEVWFELAELTGDAEWKEMLAEFGEYYTLTEEELLARTNGAMTKQNWEWPMFGTRLIAWAGRHWNRADLAERAWQILLDDYQTMRRQSGVRTLTPPDTPEPVREIPWLSTNWASQWSLNVIECLVLAPGALDGLEPPPLKPLTEE